LLSHLKKLIYGACIRDWLEQQDLTAMLMLLVPSYGSNRWKTGGWLSLREPALLTSSLPTTDQLKPPSSPNHSVS